MFISVICRLGSDFSTMIDIKSRELLKQFGLFVDLFRVDTYKHYTTFGSVLKVNLIQPTKTVSPHVKYKTLQSNWLLNVIYI